MAEKQSPTEKAAAAVDPTVRSRGDVPEYPEGTHPPAPPEKQTWGPGRFSYKDMTASEKPDKSTIAQTVEDKLDDKLEKARADSSD